jgi:hypothetical protein
MNNIPKIAHFYWGRNNPLTFLQFLTVVSFREYHPEWTIKVYFPSNITSNISWKGHEQKVPITSRDYFDDLDEYKVEKKEIDFETIGFSNDHSEVIKSDYLRYYVLNKEGGIWSDFDIIYINSLEKIDYSTMPKNKENGKIDFGISHFTTKNYTYYSVGLIVSTPGNPIIKNITNNTSNSINSNDYQTLGIRHISRLYPSPAHLCNRHPDQSIVIFPAFFYLPMSFMDLSFLFDVKKDDLIKDNTVGIHWFNGAGPSRQFENQLEKNEHKKTGSLYKYIEKYLHLKR